jgi:uncharacterized coiled-coil protein SlyX
MNINECEMGMDEKASNNLKYCLDRLKKNKKTKKQKTKTKTKPPQIKDMKQ